MSSNKNSAAEQKEAVASKNSANVVAPTPTVKISVKTLLEAGAHFGHQAQRWNPRMLPYIYCERNGIHIINLDLTIQAWQKARKYVVDTIARGGNILFVGTKTQGREIVNREAQRSGAYYVTSRWLGGTLSNFQTIKNSIDRMRKLEDFLGKAAQENSEVKITKKEKLTLSRQLEKLAVNLGGIRDMRRPPDVIFVTDVNKEAIAVAEARKLRIPVIALVDTNSDPDIVDFPVPCNDDASRTLQLLVAAVADAVAEGRALYDARTPQHGSDGSKNGVKGGDEPALVAQSGHSKDAGSAVDAASQAASAGAAVN